MLYERRNLSFIFFYDKNTLTNVHLNLNLLLSEYSKEKHVLTDPFVRYTLTCKNNPHPSTNRNIHQSLNTVI